MFCSCCAVVTSPATTNACAGGCCPNAPAIWLNPDCPTTLKLGACVADAPPLPPPLGADIVGADGPLAFDKMFFACAAALNTAATCVA